MRGKWTIAIWLWMAAGCVPGSGLDYRGEVPPPKWTVFAYVEADSLVRAEVEKSGTYADDMLLDMDWNPQGEIYVNGEYAGALLPEKWNRYTSSVRPRAGDRVTIRVSGEDCGEAVGETVVRLAPPLVVDVDTSFEDGKLEVSLRMLDDGSPLNFYRVQAEHIMYRTYLAEGEDGPVMQTDTFVYYNENVSDNSSFDLDNSSIFGARRDLNPYNLFTNEDCRGERVSVRVDFDGPLAWEREEWLHWRDDSIPYIGRMESCVRVQLLRLDEPLYQFFYSLGLYERQFELYKEPSSVYTNVRGGLGVVGNCSTASVIFDFRPAP